MRSFGLAWCGTQLTRTYPNSFLVIEASFLGTMGMKVIPTLAYLHVLVNMRSGELMGTLKRMKLPASIVMGIACGLRFIPVLKQTFINMRRGSIYRRKKHELFYRITHPLQSSYYYLVPYISRMIQISDDLAAALSAKGIGLHENPTATRQLIFKSRDYITSFGVCMVYMGMILWN